MKTITCPSTLVLTSLLFTPLFLSIPCSAQTITVDDDGPADFNSIQAAIDISSDGDTIIVRPGLYDEDIYFLGKNITLASAEPNNPDVTEITVIKGTLQFNGTEDPNCTLAGFSIRDPLYGAIYGNNTHATISHCILSGNGPCEAVVVKDCDGTIGNCLISDNFTSWRCGIYPVIQGCDGLITNCTIANNLSGIGISQGDTVALLNCIVYYNSQGPQITLESGAALDISYCDIQDGLQGIYLADSNCTVNWQTGNIDTDPCFVRLGYADPEMFFEGDYHLQSAAGRWDTDSSAWVVDANTSWCIDAGDPNSDWTAELWPHGKHINMGTYGGTSQASMSLSDAGNIADLNHNQSVDYSDLILFMDKWLCSGPFLPEDFDRNAVVDFYDFNVLADNWLHTDSGPCPP